MENISESKDYSFPVEEERILAFWDDIDAFKEQLRRTEGLPEYVFYDGPPFATGLPHYGHILTGTLKVCVHGTPRHQQPPPPGYRHALCQPDRPPCHPAFWLGLPWLAGGV